MMCNISSLLCKHFCLLLHFIVCSVNILKSKIYHKKLHLYYLYFLVLFEVQTEYLLSFFSARRQSNSTMAIEILLFPIFPCFNPEAFGWTQPSISLTNSPRRPLPRAASSIYVTTTWRRLQSDSGPGMPRRRKCARFSPIFFSWTDVVRRGQRRFHRVNPLLTLPGCALAEELEVFFQ